jgi:hypothetical protein
LLSPGRYFQEMVEAGLTSEETSAITGGNAVELFRITV